MNVERLHAIAVAVKQELDAQATPAAIERLVNGLQAMVEMPQQPQSQQEVSAAISELETRLPTAASNEFSASWRQTLQELGIDDLLGDGLLQVVTGIMRRNEMTPAIANEELKPYAERLRDTNSELNAMIQAFGFFDVPTEDLEPGEVELSVLIPRGAVENELPDLGQEFIRLQRVLGPFVELATGSRPDLKVRAIASSDFSVYLAAVPAAGWLIASALDKVLDLYKKVLEIRALRQQLQEQAVPDDAMQGITDYASEIVARGIEDIVAEMTEGHEELGGRIHELQTELRRSLNEIATRIDQGYNFDVRSEPLPLEEAEDEDDTAPPEPSVDQQHLSSIHQISPRLKFLTPVGQPILSLPESPSEDRGSE